jgi:hypothetical protein
MITLNAYFTRIGKVGAYRDKEFEMADLTMNYPASFYMCGNRLELNFAMTAEATVKYWKGDPNATLDERWKWFQRLPTVKKILKSHVNYLNAIGF